MFHRLSEAAMHALPPLLLSLSILAVLIWSGCAETAPPEPHSISPAPTLTGTPAATATAGTISNPSTPAGVNAEVGLVTEVVDSDTIKVNIGGSVHTVRYILIDTPETVHPTVGKECFGAEAKAANAAHVNAKTVTLEKDVSETDRYGRLLHYVYLDGVMVNEQLVRDGYAVLCTFPPDLKYLDRIRAAEQEARSANRGLWAACGGADTPIGGTHTPTGTPGSTASSPAYPTVCIPPPPPDLNCGDISFRRFEVRPPDPPSI